MEYSIDFSDPMPLYHQVKEDLYLKIQQGELKPGNKMPTEKELMNRYNVSRITVRNAILALVNQGLLVRQRGIGTFVAKPKAVRFFPGVTSFTEDMKAKGMKSGRRLLSFKEIIASPSLIKKMELRHAERVVQIERLMFADDEPIAIHFISIPMRIWALVDISVEDLKQKSLYQMIEQNSNIRLEEAEENIEGGLADSKNAKLLGIKENSPILLVERFVRTNNGEVMEYSNNTYRADRYKYNIKHKRKKINDFFA